MRAGGARRAAGLARAAALADRAPPRGARRRRGMKPGRARFALAMSLGAIAVLALAAWSFGVGKFPVGALDAARALLAGATGAHGHASNVDAVVLQVRAPRIAAALAVGAALAAAGAA